MDKNIIHPENEDSYFEDIDLLADFVHNALMCGDVNEEYDGGNSIEIENLPYKIPKDKSVRKDICKNLCEALDRIHRDCDSMLEQTDIGNGDFYMEEPYYTTPPVSAFFDNKKLHIY